MDLSVMGVVGCGAMGRGIAQIAAQAGATVRLVDSRPGAVTEGRAAVRATFERLAAKGKMTAAEAEAATARLVPCVDVSELAGCELVVEAIVEDLEAKRALFRALEPIVGDACILATNTSSLSVTAIAAGLARPGRVAGFHFFNPVPLMKVVEVVSGLLTEGRVTDRLVELAGRMGHTPVRAKDSPGFIVNHAGRGFNMETIARNRGERIAATAIA